MSVSELIGDWHALAVLFVAGVIPNQIWRMLGLWFGGGIDEGSELLIERLKHKVAVDFDTARRLFTLISVLHWKG